MNRSPSLSSSVEVQGRYSRHEGIHVLRLTGTDYEMGFQHGVILREAIARGPIPYYAGYVRRILAGAMPGLAAGAFRWLISQTVGRRIGAGLPPSARDSIEGLADGAGIPVRKIVEACAMPETYLWFLRTFVIGRGRPKAPRLGVPFLGCSSVVAWGAATVDGSFLHGRNFDYQGVGAWDSETAVVFHEPREGFAYASVASAGILLGGVTAMNEAGLTLAVHQHIASIDTALGGEPVGFVGDRIMREAGTLDEARQILDDNEPNGCWTYLIGSGSEKGMLVYEITPRRRAWFVVDGDTFGYTNIYLDPDLAASEVEFYPSQWRWNTGRYHRILERLAGERGKIDPDRIASILGDRTDPCCRIRTAISMLLTVGSVVFDPDRARLYVGSGRAPTSSRPFVPFDLARRAPLTGIEALEGGLPGDPEAGEAFDAYREAYEAYFNREDPTEARVHLASACDLQPREALYRFVASVLDLSAGESRRALEGFEICLALGHPDPERVAAFSLWKGRALDRMGERRRAQACYRAAGGGDPSVQDAARRGLARPWRGGPIFIEFTFADVVRP